LLWYFLFTFFIFSKEHFMNRLLKFVAFTGFILVSYLSHAETLVASTERLQLFLGSPSSFVTASATGTSSLNPIKILQLDTSASRILQQDFQHVSVLASSKKTLFGDTISFAGRTDFLEISEKGIARGQCVALAKAMTGSTKTTSKWYAGTKLGNIPTNELSTRLLPGTMIAFFDGYDTYNGSARHHVATFLSLQTDANGTPMSITVADQNFINGYSIKIDSTTYSRQNFSDANFRAIAIHNFAWTVKDKTHLSASEYSIVDVR
jgi:hypothetical protein